MDVVRGTKPNGQTTVPAGLSNVTAIAAVMSHRGVVSVRSITAAAKLG